MNISMMAKKFVAARTALAAGVRKAANLSDFERWSAASSLSSEWDARTIEIARLVPGHSSVLEFGAGRMILPRHLPVDCTYTPSDICERGPGTIVCDLNHRPLPDFPQHDVIVFSGVLEYVNDVPTVIAHIAQTCRMVVASYVTAPNHGMVQRLRRRRAGWVNDFSSDEFIDVFRRAGFALIDEFPFSGTQNLYRFECVA